jgi:hypothetical protein
MRLLGTVALFSALSSFAMAEDIHQLRDAPASRAVPSVHDAVRRVPAQNIPALRPPVGTTPNFHRAPNPDHIVVMTHQPSGHIDRPVARHVRLHGGLMAVPEVIMIGVPVILDVPELGPVSVAEDSYGELYQLLTSDNPDDWERAYTELKQIKQKEVTTASTGESNGSASVGPTNTVPHTFKIVHPTTSEPDAASKNTPDLTERFEDLPTRARRLW